VIFGVALVVVPTEICPKRAFTLDLAFEKLTLCLFQPRIGRFRESYPARFPTLDEPKRLISRGYTATISLLVSVIESCIGGEHYFRLRESR